MARREAKYLREHPICEWHEGCLARAHHVHHVDGMGPTGPAGLDEENFLGLCASHHARTETAIRARNELGQWIR